MKKLLKLLSLSFLFGSSQAQTKTVTATSIYDFTVKTIDGSDFKLAQLKGKKVMIVNTASECGFTPQYKELETLYQKYKQGNFLIIGFPSNDFGGQEPGSNKDIATFCQKNYGVTFPMMEKIAVKGDKKHELYAWLTQKDLNGAIDSKVSWNFQKYLIDESGKLVKVVKSSESPMADEITKWIESNK